jgi:hypothetical protein
MEPIIGNVRCLAHPDIGDKPWDNYIPERIVPGILEFAGLHNEILTLKNAKLKVYYSNFDFVFQPDSLPGESSEDKIMFLEKTDPLLLEYVADIFANYHAARMCTTGNKTYISPNCLEYYENLPRDLLQSYFPSDFLIEAAKLKKDWNYQNAGNGAEMMKIEFAAISAFFKAAQAGYSLEQIVL